MNSEYSIKNTNNHCYTNGFLVGDVLIIFFPQLLQRPVWTQIVPPNSSQVHLIFSLSRKLLIPKFFIYSKFSIMFILYLVLYLVSKCFNFSHGYFPHSKQNFLLLLLKASQFLILHLTRVTRLFISGPRHPGHLFLSLR